MSRKKYYLAGQMSGLPDNNYPMFNKTAATLRGWGYRIENPAEHTLPSNTDYHHFLKAGIKKLVECEGLILLPGWENSNGARIEYELAINLDMDVITLDTFLNAVEEMANRL